MPEQVFVEEIYLYTLIITLIQQFISLFGIVFNLAIVWITIKNKSLQTSFGLLIALNCLYDTLNESSTFLPTILILFQTKISLLNCFYVSILQSLLCGLNAIFITFFISIDRLIGWTCPIFYSFVLEKGAKVYVLVLNIIASFICFYFIYTDYLNILKNKDVQTYCEPTDMVIGDVLTVLLNIAIFLILLTLIIYIILGCLIKFSKNENKEAKVTRQMYKSLAIIITSIIFLDFFGLFAGRIFVPLLSDDLQIRFLYFRLFSQFITVSGALNCPILYLCRQIFIFNFFIFLNI